MWKNRLDLQILTVILIVAAMLKREYPFAGHWLAVSVIAYYLVAKFTKVIRIVKNFKSATGNYKILAAVYFAMIFTLANSLLTGNVNFFLIIILFAIEFLSDSDAPKQDLNE
ncbi:MAG: hypothetical protein LIO79_06645 [Rikenellaceae bacterium]|nr:hypothetical protein [Rikenellaceae bacterium]